MLNIRGSQINRFGKANQYIEENFDQPIAIAGQILDKELNRQSFNGL